MVKGGEAAGGGAWRGRSRAREPSSLATGRWRLDPKVGARSRAGLARSRVLREAGGGTGRTVVTPGAGRSHGALKHLRSVRGGGRLARVLSLSRPARAGAGEQQAGAS